MNTESTAIKIVVIVFAVIGLLTVIALLAAGLMHAGMMSMMPERMMSFCQGMLAVGNMRL